MSRTARVLALTSMGVFLVGALPGMIFWVTAEWGGTSEVDGMALMGGAIMSMAMLAVCSLVGLALALVARRRGAYGLVWRLATAANLAGLAAVCGLVLFILTR